MTAALAKAAARHRRYQQRKLDGVCVHCQAGLTDEDGIECVECVERHDRWRASDAGRASKRASDAKYHSSPAGLASNRTRTRRRAKCRAAGICLECRAPATRGQRCDVHGAAHVARSRVYRARRRGKQ
jgi:hypothetical protein